VPHTLVFCNTIEACRRVENALRRADRRGHAYRLWVYHSAVNAEGRQRALQQFAQPQAEVGADGAPLPRLLVCTDRASRGMDFPQAAALHNLAPPAAACACAFVLHVHVHVHVLHVHVRICSACARVHAHVHVCMRMCTCACACAPCAVHAALAPHVPHASDASPPMPRPRCLSPDASPPAGRWSTWCSSTSRATASSTCVAWGAPRAAPTSRAASPLCCSAGRCAQAGHA